MKTTYSLTPPQMTIRGSTSKEGSRGAARGWSWFGVKMLGSTTLSFRCLLGVR